MKKLILIGMALAFAGFEAQAKERDAAEILAKSQAAFFYAGTDMKTRASSPCAS